MILIDKTFFKPSKDSRILAILENLHNDSGLSQNKLGLQCGISSAMANKYLKDLQAQGLLTPKPVNGKSFRYELTPEGEEKRRYLLGEYSAEIVQIYSRLKQTIREKLAELASQKIRTMALFGASETCEVVLSAIKDSPFRVIALVDNDPGKQGKSFNGHIVSPPVVLENLHFDAMLITTFSHQQEIIKQMQSLQHTQGFTIIGL